jgi:1-acyl-sn-glycerol-3-phosphate acyltransferase
MSGGLAFYRFMQWLGRMVGRAVGGLQVEGLENLPDGPFLLLANHESILDPILIQAVCPRPIHAMAKSTQFSAGMSGWLMRHLKAFPVRRYRVDPQAVRLVLRRLEEGNAVGIYVEGERSWDGRLQEPRRGTIRLALHAGVPIVPCTIAGSYEVWPRWDRHLRRGRIRIRFGQPFTLPHPRSRAERELLVDHAADRIMGTLAAQIEEMEGGISTPRSTLQST